MRQIFIIDGKFFSEGPFRFTSIPSRPARSGLYFCSVCGEVYGRVILMDNAGNPMPYIAWAGICSTCPPPSFLHSLPGSIWRGWDEDYTKSLPLELLQREFNLHLKDWEKHND